VIGAACALIAVVALISARYRTPKILLPIMFVSAVELVILVLILGVGAIDLSAMAGLIGAIGVSVDAQIVITDEVLKRETGMLVSSAKRKLEKAFYIVNNNALIAVVAMAPLLFLGPVEVKGFATSMILGSSLGALISRPAYGTIVEKLFAKESQ